MHFGTYTSDIKIFEQEIKEYASRIFQKDISQSSAFLQDAASQDSSIEKLCLKYPDFCQYLVDYSDKAELLAKKQIG